MDAYETEKDDYRSELEDEVESKIDDFVESMNNEYNSGLDYFKDSFGSEEVSEIVKKHNLIDIDAVIDYLTSNGNRGDVASYDSEEIEIDIVYQDEKFTYYIYRMS
jgi:hypothetical protein